MFTVEVREDGQLIGHLKSYNTGETKTSDALKITEHCYRYSYYEPGASTVIQGSVFHSQSDGIKELLRHIFAGIEGSSDG